MTCKDCLHFDVCQALEDSGQISKIYPSQCGCFKDKSHFVEVVRCKDCALRGREDCAMFYRCDCGEQHTWECDNDFCSYGERKDG